MATALLVYFMIYGFLFQLAWSYKQLKEIFILISNIIIIIHSNENGLLVYGP